MARSIATSLEEPAAVAGLVAEIEADLARRIESVPGPAALRKALAYSVLGGGKRLRPVLTLMCCGAAGGDRDRGRAAAGAIERIHAVSRVPGHLPQRTMDASGRLYEAIDWRPTPSFREAADRGALCCRLFLEYTGSGAARDR